MVIKPYWSLQLWTLVKDVLVVLKEPLYILFYSSMVCVSTCMRAWRKEGNYKLSWEFFVFFFFFGGGGGGGLGGVLQNFGGYSIVSCGPFGESEIITFFRRRNLPYWTWNVLSCVLCMIGCLWWMVFHFHR